MSSSSSSIKVAVRCRPLNNREISRGARPLIRIEGNQTILSPPDKDSEDTGNAKVHSSARQHSFTFDHSYDSSGSMDAPEYASQHTLFNDLGKDLLEHAFEGYNVGIGVNKFESRRGSGKSYSMMGYGSDRGLIPLTCSALFDRITETTSNTLSYTVEVSFIEIYNEKVRDLLNPKNKGNLKVREHPSLGPYVEDLSRLGVENYTDIERLMDDGNKARTVAATQMNETSSRSHSVFTVLLTQKRLDLDTKLVGEKVSRISLVDLAGSERVNSTGATGQRLKEGANINKSLTTLGKVIAALASASSATPNKGKKKAAVDFIPYRDSVLTWLLKDSLGGNSKTAMIAAISPADYEETLSTLRYADQAKKIQNKAVVNEDANAKLVRELREELAMLRARVAGASSEGIYDPLIPPEKQIVHYKTSSGEIRAVTKAELQEQLEQSEKLMADVNQTWEEKMQKTVIIQREREKALAVLGIVIEKGNVGVHTPKKMPHLVNLCEDPLMSECLLYQIKPGKTVVGNADNPGQLDIRLGGSSVLPVHCYFENTIDGAVTLHAMPGGTTMVNGLRISSSSPKRLKSSSRIILGDIHVFRFNHPEEVRRDRTSGVLTHTPLKHSRSIDDIMAEDSVGESGRSSPAYRPASPTASAVDWSYARKEALVARLNGKDVDLDKLEDVELNRLFTDIMKARTFRKQEISVGRSESRASFLDSIEEFEDDGTASRSASGPPFSRDTWTDDTSVNSTLLYDGPGASAEVELRLKKATDELQKELEAQKAEYQTKLQVLTQSVELAEQSQVERQRAEEMVAALRDQMQAQLDEQKRKYEKQLAKIARRTHRNDAGDFPTETYEGKKLSLVRQAVSIWRSLKRVNMAQTALSKAVFLKEANVLSREFDKQVTYQFTVVDQIGAPTSAIEAISALGVIEDFSDPYLSNLEAPVIAIKVLDRRNTCIYTWSIGRLEQRVRQLQRLYNLLDKPSYSLHFNMEDPFYQDAPPKHSFIGTAAFPLAALAKRLLLATPLRVLSRHTGQQVAACFLRIKPLGIAISSEDQVAVVEGSDSEQARMMFEINVDSVSGLDGADYSSIHCQIRLSSITGTAGNSEDIITSTVADVDSSGATKMRLRKSLTISATPDISAHLSAGYAHIEFFAQLKPSYILKCEKWDETKEEKPPLRPWQVGKESSDLESSTTGRRAETELMTEQVYDLKSMISIKELSSYGQYSSVDLVSSSPLDPGAFQCHQGIQRRMEICLSHGSGRQWLWAGMQDVKVGNIRLLDARGSILDSQGGTELLLPRVGAQSTVKYSSDGTSVLTSAFVWDSSAHSSLFLDRITIPSNRVLLEVSWKLLVDGVQNPIDMKVDIGLQILGREAKSGFRVLKLFHSNKITTKATHMFQVKLLPAIVNKPSDLWRLNTASTFVRGEEILLDWKPRGVSLIEDYYKLLKTEKQMADLALTGAVLASLPRTVLLSSTLGQDEQRKLNMALYWWQKSFGTPEAIKLVQDPSWEDIKAALSKMRSDGSKSPKSSGRSMKANLRYIPKADTIAKKGYLNLMKDPDDPSQGPQESAQWQKVWAVLRRPYLSLYKSAKELEELPGVINVSTVRVDHSNELEDVLSRKFAFGIYTPVSALFVSAQTFPDMLEWIRAIDPSWERNT